MYANLKCEDKDNLKNCSAWGLVRNDDGISLDDEES